MTAIKKLIDGNGNQYFPQTHTKAVVDDNGYSVESRMQAVQDVVNQAQMAIGAVPSDLTPTEDSTNWVTSGGVYNALQVVQSDVTELSGELTEPKTTTIDTTEYPNVMFTINSSGKWTTTTQEYHSIFIPMQDGEYTLTASSSASALYTILTSNATPTAGATPAYATGYTNRIQINAGGTATVQGTAGNYLWVRNDEQSNGALVPTITFTHSVSRLDEIENKVEALEEGSTALSEDEIDLSTKIAAGKYGFWGGIWRSNSQHSGWFIPISGESIRVVAGNGLVYCVFCSGTTQTASTSSSYVSGPFSIQSGDTWTYDIPENATYLWCNINAIDKRVLPSAVYCTQLYDLNSYSQKIEPKISSLSSKVGTIEDIGDTIGDNDSLVRTFKGIVFYNKDDNELYIRSLTTGTWIYKDIECLRNPIIEDNSPDASIIVVDGTYYAFATSDLNFRSTDLVHWEKLSEKTIPSSYTSSRWAPDVNYLSNKYVIYLTYNGNSLLVLSSDTILNEDRYTVEAELNLGSIDYCYYNGYLFYGSGTVYRRTMTDYKTPADDAVTLSGPSGEGPMLWHYGDYYYMFTSTPVSQNYQYDVKVYRASSLTATTWETKGKILGSASSSEILNGPGHVSEVLQDADGRYFMMMQIHIYNSGWTYRPTIIQEFRMNANGWPEFIDATGNVITKPSIMCRKPKLPLTVLK